MLSKSISPLKAISIKCLECSGGHVMVIKNCITEDCSLFPYRFGTNPKRKGISGGSGNFSKREFLKPESLKSPQIAPRSHELVQVATG